MAVSDSGKCFVKETKAFRQKSVAEGEERRLTDWSSFCQARCQGVMPLRVIQDSEPGDEHSSLEGHQILGGNEFRVLQGT